MSFQTSTCSIHNFICFRFNFIIYCRYLFKMASEESPLIEEEERKAMERDTKSFEKSNLQSESFTLDPSSEPNTAPKEKFSFIKVSRSQKILLLTLGMANFCAQGCFSVLTPFFSKDVSC